ncbi:MAG: hypothetical protein K8H88_06990 [Sandaracinaceae bacterium]|nr:hypothetical protein [Sandaracinaceae bacterium]
MLRSLLAIGAGAALAAIGLAGCACEGGITPSDGATLTLDARPRDAQLSCGESLRVAMLHTPPGTRPSSDAQEPRAARLASNRLVTWNAQGSEGRPFDVRLSALSGSSLELLDVTSPFAADRPALTFVESVDAVIVLATPSVTEVDYAWAAWFGDRFSKPRDLALGLDASERPTSLRPCEGRAAVAFLVYRDDFATGIGILDWSAGAPVRSEIAYDGAFGSWRTLLPEESVPVIQSCVADGRGTLHIVVQPGGVRPVPRLVRYGTSLFSEPLSVSIGDESGMALLLADPPQPPRVLTATSTGLSMYELGPAPLEIGTGDLDPPGPLLAAFPTETGALIAYANSAGMWAIPWFEATSSFGASVRLTDLRCRTGDAFREADGVARLVAACPIGVAGATLVQLEVCGGGS